MAFDLDTAPSREEVIKVLRTLKPGKAPGASGIAPDSGIAPGVVDDALLHRQRARLHLQTHPGESFADVYGT